MSTEHEIPNAARMYDYYLGGKDNYAADRAAADAVLAAVPAMRTAAVQSRASIARVVTHLVAERGIRQIIDLGSGLPTRENVHEIAHRIDPSTRVVYVDNDEIVCAHSRALLMGTPTVLVHEADFRRPAEIVDSPTVREHLDLDRPVAVLISNMLHLLPDSDDPQGIVATLRDALAPGSFLAIGHASTDARPGFTAHISAIYERVSSPFVPRSHADIARFFGDFVLEEPGLVNVWPFVEPPDTLGVDLIGAGYTGIGRKP